MTKVQSHDTHITNGTLEGTLGLNTQSKSHCGHYDNLFLLGQVPNTVACDCSSSGTAVHVSRGVTGPWRQESMVQNPPKWSSLPFTTTRHSNFVVDSWPRRVLEFKKFLKL